ncbi:MAG: hypothetical protein IRY91_15615 [Gemmatimonadaceae bacterium]|nr:hypothetical protein [Gemmatimonadaceae bacterium]
MTEKGADLVYTNEVSAEFTVTVAGQGKGIKRTFWSSEGADDTREVTSKSTVKEGGVNHEGRTTYKGASGGSTPSLGSQ